MTAALLLSLVLSQIVSADSFPLSDQDRAAAYDATPDSDDISPRLQRIDTALSSGRGFLLSKQERNGAWRSRTYGPFKDGGSLTALTLRALLALPADDAEGAARVDDGIQYLVRMVQSDGSINSGNDGLTYPVYTAANAVVALSRSSNPQYKAARDAWLTELRRWQLSEELGWQLEDAAFGGWSYSTRQPVKPALGKTATPLDEPNLSATVFAVEALRIAGCDNSDPAFRNALRFVERCQNWRGDDSGERRTSVPRAERSKISRGDGDQQAPVDTRFDDGGFIFIHGDPIRNKAGSLGLDRSGRKRFASYGSTTADGLRCLIECGVPLDTPRVIAARGWLRDHFDPAAHPGGYGTDREHSRNALYFYYVRSNVLALQILMQTDAASRCESRDQAVAFADELLQRQHSDGSWSNPIVAVREDDPLVATPFAIEALSACRTVIAFHAGRGSTPNP